MKTTITLLAATERVLRAALELQAQINNAPETNISAIHLRDFVNDVVAACSHVHKELWRIEGDQS